MIVTVIRTYEMQSAHRLTAGVPENHKCRRPHGHRYIVTLAFSGEVDPATGMVIEYQTLDRIVVPAIIAPCDHRDLNTLTERYSGTAAEMVAANPTVENLVTWMFGAVSTILAHAIKPRSSVLSWIEIEEDSRSRVRFGG